MTTKCMKHYTTSLAVSEGGVTSLYGGLELITLKDSLYPRDQIITHSSKTALHLMTNWLYTKLS